MLTQDQFIRNFSVMANGEVDFFLGSGASIASGIPTGGDLVWEFKRSLYCSECGISTEQYKDLALPSTRKTLQDYFDRKGSCPQQYSSEEYSYYFEKCYSDPLARKRFIESIVSDREPSVGYLCLAEAVAQGKVKNVWTTNFDPLLENAIHLLYPTNNILICSEANRDSVRLLNPQYPVVGKLHGDYRYDWLRNTEDELQQLEEKIKEYAAGQLMDKQLVVIGYSGSDESIMSFLESFIDTPAFLSKGLLWTIRKGGHANPRVERLIKKACDNGKNADLVEIDGFDQLMFSIYRIQCYHNDVIDGQTPFMRKRDEIHLFGQPVDSFIKLNSYEAEGWPLCNSFETDITSWKELRSIIGGNDIIAGLYSKHVYAFSSAEKLTAVFKEHILSPIVKVEAPERDIHKSDSVYIGLIYLLIKRTLISKGMKSCGKYKVYNPSSLRMDMGFQVFDAVEIAISYIAGNLYLNLLPTVYVCGGKGERLDKETKQIQVNRIVSRIYNKVYNEKLQIWEILCNNSGKFVFENDGFIISFNTPAVSVGGVNRKAKWITKPACKYTEPIMCFSDTDKSKRTVNQLKGLCQYGPIDCSYVKNSSVHPSVRLAVFSPEQDMDTILAHLNKLNSTIPNEGKDKFLPHYGGFERVYHRPLYIPTKGQSNICVGYNRNAALKLSPSDFLAFIKRGVNAFSSRAVDFDILVIYIPKCFANFRTAASISSDFNLHML